MDCSRSLNAFRSALAAHEVTRTIFRNRHGYWAKSFEELTDIFVEIDEVEYILTLAEFRSLSTEEQNKINEAPSQPLPLRDGSITVDRTDITVDQTDITVDRI